MANSLEGFGQPAEINVVKFQGHLRLLVLANNTPASWATSDVSRHFSLPREDTYLPIAHGWLQHCSESHGVLLPIAVTSSFTGA